MLWGYVGSHRERPYPGREYFNKGRRVSMKAQDDVGGVAAEGGPSVMRVLGDLDSRRAALIALPTLAHRTPGTLRERRGPRG